MHPWRSALQVHTVFSAGMPKGPAGIGGNLSIVSSTDGGTTWGTARPVYNGAGDRFISSGMVNRGLEMKHGPHAGRLVVPREVFFGDAHVSPVTPGGFENKAGVIFSDDHGLTWDAGDFLPPPFREEEPAVAELGNGSLVITCRNGQNRSASNLCTASEVCRVFARSDDGGQTWASTWAVPVSELPAHRCEAAMVTADLEGHPTGVMVFGAPMNSTTGDRTNYTLYHSMDGGSTFGWGAGLYPGSAGYSGLVVLGTERLTDGVSWRVDVGAAFQAGHDLGRHVEGGGYDMAFARASIVVKA